MISPIQVRSHVLRHVSFSWQHPRPESSEVELQIKLRHNHTKDEKHWSVIIRVEVIITDKEEKLPKNQIEVEFEGIFSIHPDYPEENTEALVRMNGGAILYGSVRELIHQLSSRTSCGAFELPAIDARVFIEDGHNEDEEEPEVSN